MTRVPMIAAGRGLGAARGFERERDDYYPTPARPICALLDVEEFPGGVWEPACGNGAMSRVLIQYGRLSTVSTDLIYRGYGRGGVDFLKARSLRRPNVATNPPFKHWQEFAAHALELGARKVALLGRLMLLGGWERSQFFLRTRLTRVWGVGRIDMLPPGAVDAGFGGTIEFAWFVWDRSSSARRYQGPIINWVKP